jgi:hypothetical protein
MACSGGFPELAYVHLGEILRNVDWLTFEPSLLVPSVREVSIRGRCTEEEALLLCAYVDTPHLCDCELVGLGLTRLVRCRDGYGRERWDRSRSRQRSRSSDRWQSGSSRCVLTR